jgi:phage shock protein PspC (stress-responsive transcriptional regulator)
MNAKQMRQHVIVVGALNIGMGALGILLALIVFVAVVGGGLVSGDEDAIAVTSIVGSVVGFFLFIVFAPGVIAGIGLLRWKPWARILALILAVLNLVNIPIGTAIGIYTIWALMQPETEELFNSGGGQ